MSTPLTLTVFGLWLMFERTARRKHDLDVEDDENEAKIASKLEERIMKKIRTRTGIRVANTFPGAEPTSGQA